jgi:cytochrome c oxidase subunit 1
MSTTADAATITPPEHHYLNASRGIRSWLFTLDHKRIGLLYLAAIIVFFLVGGLIALAMRIELFTAKPDLVDGDTYNKLFTLHGAIMIFLVIIPSIPAVLGNFLLPLMIGAKDVAFPRLNLASFYFYVAGAVVLLYTIVAGGLDTGWTFYVPYSISTDTRVISALIGAFILGFSSILTGVNFIVTMHKMRAPGLTWYRMPLLLWALYATAVIQILATPVLAITLLLLGLERTFGIGIFDPSIGGDPVLFEHFFWFYSHPAVYIMILPAFGVESEIITVHSRKHIFGYKAIALSSVAIAGISFLVWGHHMFVSGQSLIAGAVFSVLTFGVAVPTAIKVFSWMATLYKGSIQLNTAMLYGLIFIFLFAGGGLTGLFLGTLATDVFLHDTYFVVAHFHFTMMGGTLIGFLGGLFHWWPKITGRLINERWGKTGAVLVLVGFVLTFVPLFIAGSRGMPRRYHEYLAQYEGLQQLATVGAFLLATGLGIALFTLLWAAFKGKPAPSNPWGGVSLEWQTTSPPDPHNFHEVPVVDRGPYDFDAIETRAAEA